ncbi:MAG: mannose-1-phosphate guanylyltransferase [Planctomycetaceae bacterium]
MLHAVIMAGGSGTRFWPQSRRQLPKQLLKLAGERTMIQETVDRVAPEIPAARTWVVTNASQEDETRKQLPELPAGNFLIEPCGRNTAPCIGLAAIRLLHDDPEAVMLVMPADHVIQPAEQFRQAVNVASGYLASHPEAFVLFGVPPTYPSTGFGYIERGNATDGNSTLYHVQSFREKPDQKTAAEYLSAGSFYWNCGIFLWRASAVLNALREYEPDIHERLQRLSPCIGTPEWEQALETEFPAMNKISIDYAVLERARDVVVMQAPFGWDDVGSWLSLPRLLGEDDQGNTIDARHVGLDTSGTIIRSTDPAHLIATLGIDDLLVVHTPDATLVARKDDENAVREIVKLLEEQGDEQFL